MKKCIISAVVVEVLSFVLFAINKKLENLSVILFLLGGVLLVVGIVLWIKGLFQKAGNNRTKQAAAEPIRDMKTKMQSEPEAKPAISQPEEPEKPRSLTEEEKEQLIKAIRSSINISFDDGSKAREGVRSEKGRSVIVGSLDFTAIDIETTGLSPKDNEIIELGAVKYRDGEIVSQYQQLINPGVSIPKSITKLTGITDEMVSDAPSFGEAIDGFLDFVGDDLLLGHNTNFDINFIYDACVGCGHEPIKNDFIDTMRIAKKMHPEYPNHKLQTLISELGIEDQGHHRSVADCIMTAECYLQMLQPYPAFFTTFREAKDHAHADHQAWNAVTLKEIVPNEDAVVGETPLTGKVIVFTGKCSVPRRELMQLAVNAGAKIMNTVTKKTNYLVTGKKELAFVNEKGLSKKEEKALELNAEKSASVAFITEDEFRDMIHAYAPSV